MTAKLSELGMPSIPSIFAIPKVQDVFDDAGQPHDSNYPSRAKKFLDELEWYASALKAARQGGVPY